MTLDVLAATASPLAWGGFLALVLGMLALDLGVFHRSSHVVSTREALSWSVVWVGLAVLFGVGVWVLSGADKALEYFSAYVVEKTLSVDNVFVFAVIFGSLAIPAVHQHRVLFWGILTALVLRAVMIVAGAALLERFHGLIYVFGAFLVLTGVKLLLRRGDHDPSASFAFRAVKRLVPTSPRLDGQKFFTKVDGRRLATPLFAALLLVEVTDVIFALDSIPAVLAISRDPFIVFTSNVFAILGLRSLYFLLSGVMTKVPGLDVGLAVVLLFVGSKMAAVDVVKVPTALSFGVILAILTTSVLVARARARRREAPRAPRPSPVPAPASDA
ncbi:MAG: TerC family protein [Planctomycetes bacterium]|nr:TerC family protein [Planctomycetota bacterium]